MNNGGSGAPTKTAATGPRRGGRSSGARRLTLAQVAERLGVSIATVSNAFNRPDQLSMALREHILAECRAMGYLGPHATSRNLRVARTGIVGVMLSNYLSYSFSDPVAHEFLEGLAEVFEEREYSLLLMPARDNVRLAGGYDSFVEGLVIYGPPQQDRVEELLHQRKSVITVDFVLPDCVSVNIDNYRAAHSVAAHALRRGAGRVVVLGLRLLAVNEICRITGHPVLFPPRTITIQRLEGFRDAAADAAITIADEDVYQVHDNRNDLGYRAAREALATRPRPELLLCMSDRLALAAMAAARDLGLSIPEELRITGFDDIPEAGAARPALTTVHQPSRAKGQAAAEIFLGYRAESDLVLPTELRVRGSCP